MVYANHTIYRGEWACDKRSGSGLFTWPEGSMYHGSFLNDMAEGKGKIIFVKDKGATAPSKEQIVFEEYWVRGIAIRILSTHCLPPSPDPKKLILGDMVNISFLKDKNERLSRESGCTSRAFENHVILRGRNG
jgi:hypothetical protein